MTSGPTTSVVTLMASALDRELRSRGLRLPAADCEQILRLVIAGPAAIGHALESRSAMPPAEPPGGGCIGGDASAVDFSSSATPAPRTSDGGRTPSGDAPAVTPAASAMTTAKTVMAVLWEYHDGPHKGARFWGCHSMDNDGRLRDWPKMNMRALGAAGVMVVEGEGLDLLPPAAAPEAGTP